MKHGFEKAGWHPSKPGPWLSGLPQNHKGHFMIIFIFGCEACEIFFPQPGIEPTVPAM